MRDSADQAAGGGTEVQYAEPWQVDSTDGCFFYHCTDLPGLGVQHGHWDLRGAFDDYTGQVALKDRRVLDVGTASGYLSFEAEARGAAEIVSFDMDTAARQHLLPFRGSRYIEDHQAWLQDQEAYVASWKRAYWLTHRLRQSRAKVFYGDVYELPPALGQFDVTLVGSILEHLRDPLAALTSLAQVTSGTMVITTDVLDEPGPRARFEGRGDRPEVDYVFWTWSLDLYDEVLGMLGFRIVRTSTCHPVHYEGGDPGRQVAASRPVLVAERVQLSRR